MSCLPGPEPCCWLIGHFHNPGQKSLESASDRLAQPPWPADTDAHRHTENGLLSVPSSPFPTLLTQQISSSLAASPSHTHSRGPWGPASPLDGDAESCYQTVASAPPSRRPQSSLEMSLLRAPAPLRRTAFVCTHS